MAVLKLETTFERINRVAEETIARRWRDYVPLPREAFVDDWIHTRVTVMVTRDTGARATFGRPQKRAIGDSVMRPTELTATAALFASSGETEDAIPVIRLDPHDGTPMRKCACCHRTQAVTRFERVKRNISGVSYLNGLSFYCVDCRRKLRVRRAA